MQCVLDSLGLARHLKKKLTIAEVRQIDEDAVSETATDFPSQLQLFLKRLLMMNMKARNLKGDINPLDLTTALFLCSDGILQQELSLKMSLCQFAVPLLLPNCDTQKSTLMLWAMREIVKQFITHSSGDQNEFVDKGIVHTKLPVMSFVRRGNSSLSKSKFLNAVLSHSQQANSMFVHHNMTGGNTPRQISDGLVEMSWYLPGSSKSDVFSEPVAVANLRGDLQSHLTQFTFLCKTSAAVFVFCDDLNFDKNHLNIESTEAQLFIVCDSQSKSYDEYCFKKQAAEIQTHNGRMIKKNPGMNDADLVKELQSVVRDVLKGNTHRMELKGMAGVAKGLGILVDEDHGPCQKAKDIADMVINTQTCLDIPKYKKHQLPLQGKTWRELTALEKEECKLKTAGKKSPEDYKMELEQRKGKLREEQKGCGMSESIKYFIEGLKCPEEEQAYFLRWMKINLDNLCRTQLSNLRKEYRKKSSEGTDALTMLDEQIMNTSLGTEHFLREIGQLYEVSMFFDDDIILRQEIKYLAKICAELMLAGFPLELMDGDASNIPVRWISDVLAELNSLTKPNNRIRVVTVLGPQSSGKSTLLNTMFGVHFAVSSGRCTRGAFMQLIKVKDEFRKEVNCDFIMIIDTEGLRALPAHLTDNCEHDNELATLVVGLSDISIVNISTDNNTDMKDILQIVAHAFLRMKESETKPSCLFVHQNVTDVTAPDKNLQQQTRLLKQLNEMTKAASKMENIGECEFTDIIIYKPEDNCNIPGLLHGSAPMAPVNDGYSESVAKLKTNLSNAFKVETVAAGTFQKFRQFIQVLWTDIKHENFIFSFRNSIIAEAYYQLCVEYNRRECVFQKHMYYWVTNAESKVANYGSFSWQKISGLDSVLQELKHDAKTEVEKMGKVFLEKLNDYYKSGQSNVHLLESFKGEFEVRAKDRKKGMESEVSGKLEIAVDMRKCTFGVDNIMRNNKNTMDKKIFDLVKKCRSDDKPMSDSALIAEFSKMWDETLGSLSFGGLDKQQVGNSIYDLLQSNLEREGPQTSEMLSKVTSLENCGNEEFIVKKEHYAVTRFVQKNLSITRGTYDNEKMIREKTHEVANEIISKSKMLIANTVRNKRDYHSTHTKELLELIDQNLERHSDFPITAENAAALKIHICGNAARQFQEMSDAFIKDNDPWSNLERMRPQYLLDFRMMYTQKDQCNRKAKEFTNSCLKPAVEEYIRNRIGIDILKEVQSNCHGVDFKTKRSFQFSMLKNLISSDFSKFQEYIDEYDTFSKKFIENAVVDHVRKVGSIANMEIKHLEAICQKLKNVVSEKSAGEEKDLKFTQFIQDLHSECSELVIPDNTTGLILEDSKTKEFSKLLTDCVTGMKNRLKQQFDQEQNVREKLRNLPVSPQDKLHSRMSSCGAKCLFCNTPCEAEAEGHLKHTAKLHRPAGFGGYTWRASNQLVKEICTDHRDGLSNFRRWLFNITVHFKHGKYDKKWDISPARSKALLDYWKFLFVEHHEEYAKHHKALLPYIPEDWKAITSEQALESLTNMYYPKYCLPSNG